MSKQKTPPKTTRQLATRIADHLFVNGSGEQAERLVLEIPGKPGASGGWCKRAVVDVIARHLDEAEKGIRS